jgi:hypothetical protein
MPKLMLKYSTFSFSALFLASCANQNNAEFINCWGATPKSSQTFQFNFRALAYPRDGYIAINPDCPQLRLIMIIPSKLGSPSDEILSEIEEKKSAISGIKGRAIARFGDRVSPNSLRAEVIRLEEVMPLSVEEVSNLQKVR